MEKPIYTTDIDERTKIGQALYFSSYFITFLKVSYSFFSCSSA